jgi:multidrug efflux pump subunit AcrB
VLIAIYRGTPERLRPILITMLTTVMALVPIAVDTSQTSTQSSMAVWRSSADCLCPPR